MRGVTCLRRILITVWAIAAALFIYFILFNASNLLCQKRCNFSFLLLRKRNHDNYWQRSYVAKKLNVNSVKTDNISMEKTIDANKEQIVVKKTPEAKAIMAKQNNYTENTETCYYSPRSVKVNPIQAEFIINADQICSANAKYMTILIIVPSTPSHLLERDAIRSTYGSYSKRTFYIENNAVEVSVRLLFLIGKDEKMESDRIIRNESDSHGDIVYADFIDTYRNLTQKMLIALKWVSYYCNNTDFVLKVDEDVFVNIPELARILHSRAFGSKGTVYGHVYPRSIVHRAGRWGVSKDEYPMTYYPPYVSGTSYVISSSLIYRMFKISEHLPYMPIEDVFITGCLAKVVEAKVASVPGFSQWNDKVPDPCQFVKSKRISSTKVNPVLMLKLWKACNSYSKTCAKLN